MCVRAVVPPRCFRLWGGEKEKAQGSVSVARSSSGGSGMPITAERATQKPYADMYSRRLRTVARNHPGVDEYIHIHKASTAAALLTVIEIYQISACQERASINAFHIMLQPTFHNPQPGFCMAVCLANLIIISRMRKYMSLFCCAVRLLWLNLPWRPTLKRFSVVTT